MTTATELSYNDTDKIKELLLGHRIVSAETGNFTIKKSTGTYGYRWEQRCQGKLSLDNGTTLYVETMDDCCSYWEIEHLATVDNIITDVRLVEPDFDAYEAIPYREVTDEDRARLCPPYAIYVVADATEVNVLTVDGGPGNYPYYATGYRLHVIPGGED